MSNNEQIIMEEAAGRKTPAEKIDALLREAMAYEGSWPELRRLRLIQRLADALRRHYDEEADECPECRIDNREMEILRLSESLDVHKKMLANRDLQFDVHVKSVSSFLNELYLIIDPLAEGEMKVSDMTTMLIDTARKDRETREHLSIDVQNLKEIERTMLNQVARLRGYLRDAVNALESMPGTAEEWHKYTRWAEGLRNQTVERIKRELSI